MRKCYVVEIIIVVCWSAVNVIVGVLLWRASRVRNKFLTEQHERIHPVLLDLTEPKE